MTENDSELDAFHRMPEARQELVLSIWRTASEHEAFIPDWREEFRNRLEQVAADVEW